MNKLKTYHEWDAIRLKGRGGRKKVRRDFTLAKRNDGVLTFTYNDREVLVTLAPDNTYTLYKPGGNYYSTTYSNVIALASTVIAYSDMSHYRHYAEPVRVSTNSRRWVETETNLPFISGLQFRHGKCINPEIAVDYKRTLNRTKSLPLLRKTEVLAKLLRVATRMGLLKRDMSRNAIRDFDNVNLDDPTAEDAEIILSLGGADGLYRWHNTPEAYQAALMRAANNGLADYREWLYQKHGCYEMQAVETKGEE
jgi:hypothetical protein